MSSSNVVHEPTTSFAIPRTAAPGVLLCTLQRMCGRYVSFSDPEQLAERFAVDEVRTEPLPPRYNVAPTLDVYAVIEAEATRRLGTLRWGFVPPWSKDPRKGPAPINARVEGLAESKMFAPALARRRCLLPADGFYEWQQRGEGRRKQPYYLHDPEGDPLAFAGIFSAWRDPEAGDETDPLFSCAIVTTRARGEMERIHHRSPLILPERLWSAWLTSGPEEVAGLRDTVAELGPPRLTAEPVSDRVNSVRNDGPELLEHGEVTD